MVSEQQAALLAQANNAVVGVNRAQGAPQLTIVWYAWDGSDFYFSTTKDRAKYLNITRDPAISLLVDDPVHHTYVAAYGRAEIVEQDSAVWARRIIEKYLPADQAEQMIAGIANDPNRVIVALHPEKIIPSA